MGRDPHRTPRSREEASINGLLPESRAEEHGEAQLQGLFYRHTLHRVERPTLEPPHVRLHLAQVPADLLLDGGWQLVRAAHLQSFGKYGRREHRAYTHTTARAHKGCVLLIY